jgi:hypothetical protein
MITVDESKLREVLKALETIGIDLNRSDRIFYAKLTLRSMLEQRPSEPDTYAVVNLEGEIEYSASWPEACHDHIKDAQEYNDMGHTWVVRGVKILPLEQP